MMIRVLHSVSNMDRAGIETMLMNYYRHIDRSKIQFDFLVNKSKPGNYDDEIRGMGGRIFQSPGLNPIRYFRYLRFLRELLAKNPEIKILHAHNEAMGLYALNGAKKAGLSNRIAHAHNTRLIRDYKYPLKRFCKVFLPRSATALWSCGRDAGVFFFGAKQWEERGMVMRNAIETEQFAFSETVRKEMRAVYRLEGKTVLGHVGRFNVQKNHTRLLSVFYEYAKRNREAVLVLIGEGELEEAMKEKAEELGISERVFFVGLSENVRDWYMAMDVFIMPSLFEGLPVVGVEAQCAGLPCLFSDAVTEEVCFSEYAERLSLSADDRAWAEKIDALVGQKSDRRNGKEAAKRAGYDITTEAKRIEELYLNMSQSKEK